MKGLKFSIRRVYYIYGVNFVVMGFRNPAASFAGRGEGRAAVISADPLPVISAVDPSSGDTAGGETVTVWGTGFKTGDQITVDGNATTEVFVNSGKMTFITPADTEGTYDVLVVRGGDQSNAKSFTYVTGGGLPSDMLFASDFGTGTGTGDAAVRDTGKTLPWNTIGGVGSSNLNVVANPLGNEWPSTNAMMTRNQASTAGRFPKITEATWGIPGAGEKRYWRGYYHALVGLNGNQVHPFHTKTPNTAALFRWVMMGGSSTWTLRANSNGNNPLFHNSPALSYNVTYRWEVELVMATASTGTYEVRVYTRDSSGSETLTYTGVNFTHQQSPYGKLSDLGVVSITPTADFDGLTCGINGWDVSGTYNAFYQGGYALRTDDWCGTYDSAEASF